MAHREIRKLREVIGVTQTRLASDLGLDRGTYVNFENGQATLKPEAIARIYAYLDQAAEEKVKELTGKLTRRAVSA